MNEGVVGSSQFCLDNDCRFAFDIIVMAGACLWVNPAMNQLWIDNHKLIIDD